MNRILFIVKADSLLITILYIVFQQKLSNPLGLSKNGLFVGQSPPAQMGQLNITLW